MFSRRENHHDLRRVRDRRRALTIVLSAAAMLLGGLSIAITLAAGGNGNEYGVLMGAILIVMGGMRVFLATRGSS